MKLKGLGVLTINRYKKKLIFFTFLLFLHNNIFAKTQGKIIRDGIVQTGISATVGVASEVAKTINEGEIKVATSNLVKNINKMQTIEKTLNTKKYKILKNIKYMKLQKAPKYEIKSLEKQLKLINAGLGDIKKAKNLLAEEGIKVIKVIKPNLNYAKKLKILGHTADGLAIAINVTELRQAYKNNNRLRIHHKWEELVANGAVIAASAIGGPVVGIPAAIAVGIGATFNDASEEMVQEEVKKAKNKIIHLNESLSNEALTESMIKSMQKIAKEPLSYTKNAIREKLRKAFNNDIQQMLKTVNNEIDKINKRRIYVPFKGRLVRNQGDALLYDWLQNQKNILTNIQMYSLFGNNKDNSKIAQFVKHYTDDLADKYIRYQINYLSKNDIGTIVNSLSQPQPIAVKQTKEPKVTTEKVKEDPITLAGKKVEKLPKAKTATNPNIDTNKNKLDIIKEKDAKLKVAIREKNRLDRVIEKKRERLNQLREQQNNENRYTYTGQQGKKRVKKINVSKLKYLVRARHFIQRRSNIPFSKWSKQDKVALGILATNLGVRYGSNIISRAIYLKAMLNRGKFAFLRDKYATTYTYQNINNKRVTPNPNYSMYDLQAENLLREINTLSDKANHLNDQIKVAQSSLMQLQNSLGDTVDDYLNDNKEELSSSSAPTPQLAGESWAGGTTYNSEDRSSGILRYWGGNFFDSSLLSASEGYGPIFNVDETGWEGLVDNGIIKSVRIIHGENSASDNTKEFIIRHNEIDTSSSFYDPHINSLKLKKNLPNGNTLSIKTTGHYDYSAWGSWKQTGGLYTNINSGSGVEQKAMHNNWISGERTKDLPTLGSATYSGSVAGHWYANGSGTTAGGSYGGAVDGSISLTVDFANTSMVGNMQINKVGGGSMTSATLDNIHIDRRSASFAARLTGGNVDSRLTSGSQNMISGQFFGPHAEEVGGGWNVKTTNGDLADGIFAAKRQASQPAQPLAP